VGRRVIPIEATAEEVALHEVRRAIDARAVHGRFAKWRWTMAFATQIAFYGLPWLTINGRQAMLFDVDARESAFSASCSGRRTSSISRSC